MTTHGWNFGVSDVVNLPTSQGAGYVLATDGAGGLQWVATSSIGVTDHGALTGLADDDHTGYLLATGTRTGATSQRQTFTNAVDTSAYYEIGTVKYLHIAGSGPDNLWLGRLAGNGITTGTSNVGIGSTAGYALTSGYQNLFIGSGAGTTVQAGYNNIAIGVDAMSQAGTTNAVTVNIAIGSAALQKVTADNNIAIGNGALTLNTSGDGNTAIGPSALNDNTTGYNNIAIGANAGGINGYGNFALGSYAGKNVVSRNSNTLIGQEAGSYSDIDGSVCIGYTSGQYLGTYINNMFIGSFAGKQSTGSQCVYIGQNAGYLGIASYNIGIGQGALYNVGASHSGGTVAIGWSAGSSYTGTYASAFVGYAAGQNSTASGVVGIGESAVNANTGAYVTAIGTQAGQNNTYAYCLFLGAIAKNASAQHQAIIGGDHSLGYLDDFYLGTGRVSASSGSRHTTINASGGSGTNIAGSNMTLAAGKGTGTGAGGTLAFAVAPAGSTGSSLNALFTWLSIASTKLGTMGEAADWAFGTTTGTKHGTATTQKQAWWGATPVVQPSAYTQTYSTADKTFSAYTADDESAAYTGIDNAQVGTVYATVADLNALRTAYENLRAFTEDGMKMLNSVVDDLQTIGLVA